MLANRRSLKIEGQELERTPLLIPSFSSKGFPDAKKIIEYNSEIIDGAALVSAYDLHYKVFEPPFNFPSLIFLDSGGYEASREMELSDYGGQEHNPKPWTQEMHEGQLADWKPMVPSVLISYDHPEDRLPIQEQILRAKGMAAGKIGFLREILLKPETKDQTLLQIPAIIKNIEVLAEFDVIGVTEKEVGNSIFSRMQNIAKIRRALNKIEVDTPIHVFGSLDTITTPLYFLAGADIFDGLSWLRFAFYEGNTIYKHNFGALALGVGMKANVIDARCWNNNYYYMKEMELEMRRYLTDRDFKSFKYHGELFSDALTNTIEAIGG